MHVNNIRQMIKVKFLYFVLFLLFASQIQGQQQNRINAIEQKLTVLTSEIPALEDKINISVSDVTIQEFVRGVAKNSNINIHIDPNLKTRISANYNQVRVADIIIFLCKEYNLDVSSIGSIISLFQFVEPVQEKPKTTKKEPKVEYSKDKDLLTLDLLNDTLTSVARRLTDISSKNIIVSPELDKQVISGYILNTPFDAALEKIMYSNRLSCTRTKDNFYIIDKPDPTKSTNSLLKKGNLSSQSSNDENGKINITFLSPSTFSIEAFNYPLDKLIKHVSDTLSINYKFIDKPEGDTQINLNNIGYEGFLRNVLNNNQYAYKYTDGIYLIGKQDNSLLKSSKLVRLQHRTVDKIIDIIPADLSSSLTIKEFTEQNSFIITGNSLQQEKFEAFIQEIDKVVPLVLIEIIIVEVTKSRAVSVGISAGLKSNVTNANKQISPEFNYDVSTQSINNVLGKINSIGWINFGKVSPNFYLNLKALEDDSKLTIKSTPKLSTLNGHEATMSSGETKYYKEVRNDFIGTQNPTLSNSYTWQKIDANLNIKIKPIVSSNDQVTLDITLDQTQFTKAGTDGSPPESVNRKFQSLIRMKDQEMVLLGGLDKFSNLTSSKGLPLLSRIPVLKWIFGNNTRAKTDAKLSLFIQTTIIY